MKKAILVVSFGTTYADTRKVTIDAIEEKVKERFGEYEIRRAFTSHMIIRTLKNRDGILEDTPEEALRKLKEEGFEEVMVQTLHIMPGEEYDYIKSVVEYYENDFEVIRLGRPALYFKGGEEVPDDYSILVEAIRKQLIDEEPVVLMGHGTPHPANAVYSCFESVLRDHGLDQIYMGTVEGYPTLENVIERLKRDGIKKVTLMPFMLVAGDHAKNDMAGDDEDSWKVVLESEGIQSKVYLHGLGENKKVQEIYLQHLEDIIEGRYLMDGKTKKGIY